MFNLWVKANCWTVRWKRDGKGSYKSSNNDRFVVQKYDGIVSLKLNRGHLTLGFPEFLSIPDKVQSPTKWRGKKWRGKFQRINAKTKLQSSRLRWIQWWGKFFSDFQRRFWIFTVSLLSHLLRDAKTSGTQGNELGTVEIEAACLQNETNWISVLSTNVAV